jgi:hypothetical protein
MEPLVKNVFEPMGKLFGLGGNPKAAFSKYEEVAAWESNPSTLSQYKYSKVYDEEKTITAFQAIADTWRMSAERMEKTVGVDLAGLMDQDWAKMKENLQQQANMGDQAANKMNIGMLDAFQKYQTIARNAERNWANMTDLERQNTSVMLAGQWKILNKQFATFTGDLGGTFSDAANQLGRSVQEAILSTDVHVRITQSYGNTKNLGPRDQATTSPTPILRPDDEPIPIDRKAFGGPVMPWRDYLVGDEGPEILHMGSAVGNITPNNALNKTTNSAVINIHINGQLTHSEVVDISENVTRTIIDRGLASHQRLSVL